VRKRACAHDAFCYVARCKDAFHFTQRLCERAVCQPSTALLVFFFFHLFILLLRKDARGMRSRDASFLRKYVHAPCRPRRACATQPLRGKKMRTQLGAACHQVRDAARKCTKDARAAQPTTRRRQRTARDARGDRCVPIARYLHEPQSSCARLQKARLGVPRGRCMRKDARKECGKDAAPQP